MIHTEHRIFDAPFRALHANDSFLRVITFPDRKFDGEFDRRLQPARVQTRTNLYCS
jgi:hypothetical protein